MYLFLCIRLSIYLRGIASELRYIAVKMVCMNVTRYEKDRSGGGENGVRRNKGGSTKTRNQRRT